MRFKLIFYTICEERFAYVAPIAPVTVTAMPPNTFL